MSFPLWPQTHGVLAEIYAEPADGSARCGPSPARGRNQPRHTSAAHWLGLTESETDHGPSPEG